MMTITASPLSQTLRRFNRFELKYLLTLRQAEEVKERLHGYLVPDPHGEGCYDLTSLYYDSPDLRFYSEKLDGVRVRRKLRIRHYETGEALTEDTPVYVEIKQRVDRVTQKRRARMTYREALRLCSGRVRPQCEAEDRAIMDEVETMLWQYNLHPVSVVGYHRQALIGTDYEPGLRVTFDTRLTCRRNNLQLHEPGMPLAMMRPDRAVMEVKVNDRLPAWMAELVGAKDLQLVRLSKYCLSIEHGSKHPATNWRVETSR
jgi:SPX domain protein involved in polyphosphate accumulation